MRSLVVACTMGLACLPSSARAAPLTPGNLLVTQDDVLIECTTAGLVVQSFPVPYGGGVRPATENVRDVIVGANGRTHVYDGTFDPYLSTLDPAASSWASSTYPGWSTANNVTFGGIAVFQMHVFVTDMGTAGDQAAAGIVRFDLATDTATRFATENELIDVTRGLDGRLYGLEYEEDSVAIYDPVTLALIGTIDLDAECRGISVNAAGELFGAAFDGTLYRFDPTGAVVASLESGAFQLTDIDIDGNGRIVVGSGFGDVIQTDDTFAAPRSFNLNSTPVFVAFTDISTLPACPDAAACDDGDPCTIDDRCDDSVCAGIPLGCTAGDGGSSGTGGGGGSSGTGGGSASLDEEKDDGCGCRLAPRNRGGGIFVVVAIGMFARLRRRRRSFYK